MLARVGLWYGHPSGPELITPQRLRSAAEYFRRHYQPHGAELPVDYHHGTILAAQGRLAQAPAAGWVQEVEVRANDGELWGRVMWTAEAARRIAARELRYLSPVLRFDMPDRVTGQPVAMMVHSVALTNTPFLTELGALNEQSSFPAPDPAFSDSEEGGEAMPILAQMAAALGQSVDQVQSALRLECSDDEGVAEALTARSARLHEVEAQGTQRRAVANSLGLPEDSDTAAVLSAVQALQRERRDEEARKVVDEAIAAGRVAPAQREFFLNCARDDLDATRECLNGLAPVMTPPARLVPQPVRSLSDAEQSVCRQLGLGEEAFLKVAG